MSICTSACHCVSLFICLIFTFSSVSILFVFFFTVLLRHFLYLHIVPSIYLSSDLTFSLYFTPFLSLLLFIVLLFLYYFPSPSLFICLFSFLNLSSSTYSPSKLFLPYLALLLRRKEKSTRLRKRKNIWAYSGVWACIHEWLPAYWKPSISLMSPLFRF